jgi:hypothetical protein
VQVRKIDPILPKWRSAILKARAKEGSA